MYKVEICGVNTSKLPLLTEEEKKTLFDRIQKGDTDAREKFNKANIRLLYSVFQTPAKILMIFFRLAVSV